MAAVDSLLKVAQARDAEEITIASGEVPSIGHGDQRSPLSMPPVGHELVQVFFNEVARPEDRQRLEHSGSLRTTHASADGLRYSVRVEGSHHKLRMVFTRLSQAASPAAASAGLALSTPPAPDSRSPAPPLSAPAPVGQLAGGGRSLAELCELVRVNDASDLFLSAGIAARVRVTGELREVPGASFSDDQILELFGEALSPARLETLEATGSVDLSFTPVPGARYRVNLYRQTNGLAAALRPLRSTAPTLEELNLPRDLTRLTSYQNGLVLFTGTAGAGKSTTLVALIEQLNRTQAKHVVSLEDPIEYLFQSRRALVHQREVGDHVADFASGLRAALRESPDVILLGEMRDRETTAAALTAAETGHLVLATLHASSAVVAIDRIIDIFPAAQQQQIRYQLSLVLRETFTQFLLQTVGGGARVPAYERMVVNDAIGSLIRDSRTHQMPNAIQTGRAEGMVPLELSLARLVQGGQVSLETARQVARDPGYLDELASLPRGSRL